jgi:hypothetical protein
MKKEMEGLAPCPLHRKDPPALDCPVATDYKPSLVEKGDKLIQCVYSNLPLALCIRKELRKIARADQRGTSTGDPEGSPTVHSSLFRLVKGIRYKKEAFVHP